VQHFAEMVHDAAAKPASNQRTDADGQESEPHVSALLAGRGEARNVLVIARLVNDFAHGKNNDGSDAGPERANVRQDEPGKRSDERAEDDGAEGRDFLSEIVHEDREADHAEAVGDEDKFDVGAGVDVGVNITGKGDVLLPENDPITREDEQEGHEFGISGDSEEVAERGANAGSRGAHGLFRFAEEKEDGEKHKKNAERGDAEDVFDAEMAMRPGSDVGTGGATDVDHGVVDGVAERANFFAGSAGGGADDAGLDQRNAESGKNQDETNEDAERNGSADWRKPWGANGAEEEIRASKNQIGERERAAKAEPVGGRAAEDGKKPDHAAEDAGERAGLLGGEAETLVKIVGEGGEGAVIREALKDFGNVGDPEGALEAGADVFEFLAKAHAAP